MTQGSFLGSTLRYMSSPGPSVAPSLLCFITGVENVLLFLLKEQPRSQHRWRILLCFNPVFPLCIATVSVVCLPVGVSMLGSFPFFGCFQMCVIMHHFFMMIKFSQSFILERGLMQPRLSSHSLCSPGFQLLLPHLPNAVIIHMATTLLPRESMYL